MNEEALCMKKSVLAAVFLLSASLALSQVAPKKPEYSNYSWVIMENAKVAFDSGRYGEAMRLANTAKQNRIAEINWEVYILEKATTPPAVRRVGDTFPDVLRILRERDEHDALELMEKYLRLHGSGFYGNSVSRLISWLKAKTVYPEADFLIGKIYQLEGEYKLSYDFYERARLERDYLDIPDQVYDILYAMADLAKDSNHDDDYDKALMLILDSDEDYKNAVLRRSMLRFIDADRADNVDRFFLVFRAENKNSIRALFALANEEEETGFAESALFSTSLAAVEAFTHVLTALSERDTSYEFTTLADFFRECGAYEDIRDWCTKNKMWDIFFEFAERAEKRGKRTFSQSLFRTMAAAVPENYWRSRAAHRTKG